MTKRLLTLAETYLPWLGVVGVAILFGSSLGGGCATLQKEDRPLPALSALPVTSGERVTAQTLAGRPAIINVWSPG
ncbi:MAG: hypothetical protein ACYCWW_05035 [Deltaproteobacteria bacterium]